VTLGTHLPYARNEILRRVAAWARQLPEAFLHYSIGGAGAAAAESGANWRTYPYVDYESALERFDAIVHHGGAGITYYALRAAVPVVVWPQDYDQFDFAARLEHRGLAERCSHGSSVPAALKRVIQDAAMKQRIARFAEHFERTQLTTEVRRVLREQGLAREESCEL
jgi:UDP:flavonoid glycosyltransferase YjiC (YdhE family)